MRIVTATILAALFTAPAHAGWVLQNNASRINFISTKANTAAEVHTFGVVDGDISDDGRATISIDLESVDTSIEIRDERMRTMLFETESYPTATLVAMVDVAAINALKPGESMTMTSEGQLMLHGTTLSITFESTVARLGDARLVVSSYKPVIINAGQVGLVKGVEKLREVAGLPSISPAVPVTFMLAFQRDD